MHPIISTTAPYLAKSFWLLALLFGSSQSGLAESSPDAAQSISPKSADSRCAGYSLGEQKNARLTEESCSEGQQFITAAILSGAALFDFDSNQLSPAAVSALQKLIGDLAEFRQIQGIRIIGHTDSSGPAAYNQHLSEIRAKKIAKYFTTAFPAVAVQTTGKGETEPVSVNTTRAGRYKNRRVKIEVKALQ